MINDRGVFGETLPNGWIDYGLANEWKATPAIVEWCQIRKHPLDRTVEKRGGGIHLVRCNQCCYQYTYDSSD